MNKRILYSLLALILSTFACRPVLAISWTEFLVISALFVVLLGPPLYRFIRKVEEFIKHNEQKK